MNRKRRYTSQVGKLDTKFTRVPQTNYRVIFDPSDGYDRCAVIPNAQIEKTLAFNGFDAGLIFQMGQVFYEVVSVLGGGIALKKLNRKAALAKLPEHIRRKMSDDVRA